MTRRVRCNLSDCVLPNDIIKEMGWDNNKDKIIIETIKHGIENLIIIRKENNDK